MAIFARLGKNVYRTEELEIEKLYQQDAASQSSEFDAAYTAAKQKASEPIPEEDIGASPADSSTEPSDETESDTPEEDTEDTEEETSDEPKPADSEDTPDDSEEDKKDSDVHDLVKSPGATPGTDKDKEDTKDKADGDSASMESILSMHYLAIESLDRQRDDWVRLNMEAILDDEHLERYFDSAASLVKSTASVAGDGLKYLKDLGVEYGPTVMKHVSEGVMGAVEKTAKALVQGYEKIKKYIKKRQESYTNFKSKVAKLQAAVDELKKAGDSKNTYDKDDQYKDADVIRNLKIGNTTDFRTTVEKAAGFLEAFFSKLGTNVTNSVKTTEYMLRTAGKSSISKPLSLMHEDIMFPGMSRKVLDGYEVASEHCESYVFDVGLPGDVAFIAHVPKKGLKTMDEVKSAYEHSGMFLGFTDTVKVNVEFTNYGDLEYVDTFVKALDKICDVGIKHCKVFEQISEKRDELEKSLKPYVKVLAEAKEKISLADSMAEQITLKIAFLDRTYLAGAFVLHDYMVRVLTSSLDYCKSNIDAIS